MDIFALQEICKDNVTVIKYLQEKCLLKKNVDCLLCNRPYSLVKDGQKLSGYVWKCPGCRSKISVLKDSFMQEAKISLDKFVYLAYYWATEIPQIATVEHLDISPKTAATYYHFFQDVCSWKLLQFPEQLVTVDIWKRAKPILKRMNGKSKEMLPSYLDEVMWRERYGNTYDEAYLNVLRHISEKNPV